MDTVMGMSMEMKISQEFINTFEHAAGKHTKMKK